MDVAVLEDAALRSDYGHVYLSPHLDDAALSCGATIGRRARGGEAILVITVCAAGPLKSAPPGDHARHLHVLWGDSRGALAQRHEEDRRAMQILGADHVHLSIPDCIYRCAPTTGTPYYNTHNQVFGPPRAEEGWLSRAVAQFVAQRFSGHQPILYAPLGIGGHVDHFLCLRAAQLLQERGWTVAFYEDFPYCDAGFPPPELEPQLLLQSEDDLQHKIEAISAYRTQLGVVFGAGENPADRTRAYALRLGGGKPAERVWTR